MDLHLYIKDLQSGGCTGPALGEVVLAAAEAGVAAALDLSTEEMEFAGPELWEAAVLLSLRRTPHASTLLHCIITHSKPKELLLSWSSLTTSLLRTDSSQRILTQILEIEGWENHVKAISCQCLAGIIGKLDEKNYWALVMDAMEGFLELMCVDSGTDEGGYMQMDWVKEIVAEMTERMKKIDDDDLKMAHIKAGFVFLGLFPSNFSSIPLNFLLPLIPDFYSFLRVNFSPFPSISPSISSYFTLGFVHFTHTSLSNSTFPAILTPLYRLQTLFPIIQTAISLSLYEGIVLLDGLLTQNIHFASIFTPFLYDLRPEKRNSMVNLMLEMVEMMGKTENDERRKKEIGVFKRIFRCFDGKVRK